MAKIEIFDDNKCEGCPFDGLYRPHAPEYDDNARYMVIYDAVNATSAKSRRYIAPAQKKLLDAGLATVDVQPEDYTVHPLCLCPMDPNAHTTREKTAAIKHCRAHLLDAVDELRPELIIAAGAEAMTLAARRSVQITKVAGQGQTIADLPCTVMPIMHPYQAVRWPEKKPNFDADIASLGRLLQAEGDVARAAQVDVGEIKVVYDLQELIDRDPELIAFDLETTSLRWYQKGCDVRAYIPEVHAGDPNFVPRAQILCMSFTISSGEAYVLPWDMPGGVGMPEERKYAIRNQLRKLLCAPDREVVGHNVGFDNGYLWMVEGIRFRVAGDSQMLFALHDENSLNKDLGTATKRFAPKYASYSDRFDTKYDKSRMWEVPWSDMVPYSGGDTVAAYDVYLELEDLVRQDRGNWNYYRNVSIPAINAFTALETRGWYVDEARAMPEFRANLEADVERRYEELLAQVPASIKRKHLEWAESQRKTHREALNFKRATFLIDLLFTHPDGFRLKPQVYTKTTQLLPDEKKVISTSAKDHLPYFFEECPFTVQLAEYTKMHDLLVKSVWNYAAKYVVDGKVRSKYSLSRTKTRRTASSDPNGQNSPKRGALAMSYQRQFIPPPGYYAISVDLSQAELRIAGDMAGDREMIRIYGSGGDIHIATACVVLGINEEEFKRLPKSQQKDWRTKAKAINFGFLYGMGWRGFVVYAKTQYGATFTEAEAQSIRKKFFVRYSGLKTWHERTKAFVREHKSVRSRTGLLRHLPMIDSPDEGTAAEAERNAINSPVQETGSSIGVLAVARLEERIDPKYLEIVGFIHDAIVAYVPIEYVEWGMRTIKRELETLPLKELFNWTPRIQIVAEPSFGPTFGDQHEVAGLKLDEPYDWEGDDSLWNDDCTMKVYVPDQLVPPDEGHRAGSPYSDHTYEEQYVAPTRRRLRHFEFTQ